MAFEKPIYLDNNATTPCDPGVGKNVAIFTEIYGTPANGYHIQGRMAAKAVDKARGQIANLIGATAIRDNLYWGATESNHLAIFGISRFSTNSFEID
jgi:cysteine desulfurase